MKPASFDRKGSRETPGRPSRRKKRPPPPNRHTMENETESTSSSAKKLSTKSVETEINNGYEYRLIEFLFLFQTLSEMIMCKTCGGNVTFSESSIRGLGFKLVVKCSNCEPRYINSCPLINNAYEINRRIVFAMRIIGVGYEGIRKFCGIMDLPKIYNKKVYYDIVDSVHTASQAVANVLFSAAAAEEKNLTGSAENADKSTRGLTVSGDGTWRKRGYSSLQGVTTLIGHYTGKVLDLLVKCAYCKQCEYWKTHADDFDEWMETHKNECTANHVGSAGKMEVDAAKEMFMRSEKLHGVKYTSYVGDGDCKTFKGITECYPYGENCIVEKKECVGHVQKRMGARLRKLKKDTKGLGGKGKFTAKLIDELSVYYGLAIRRNKDSMPDMKKAIWATLKHKASTNEKPQHEDCPQGEDSWCTWQQAKAQGNLSDYEHKPALSSDVLKAITPIYEELSNENLLTRCVGGYTQNSNESLNAMIWSLAPKQTFSGAKTVDIASYCAASTFNEGYSSILKMMDVMNIKIGPNAFNLCNTVDERRISQANERSFDASKEGRIERRTTRSALEEDFLEEEGVLYEAGMGD